MRKEVKHKFTVHEKLDKILRLQNKMLFQITILQRQNKKLRRITMGIGQDILDAVAAETTVISSVIAYIQQLINSSVITSEQGAAILENINSNRAALEAAIVSNTP